MVCGIPKKLIQKQFFKFKVPLRYKDIDNLIKLCSTDYKISDFPKRYTPESIVKVKRSLEECRKQNQIHTKESLKAEINLLDAAADMGDFTAIALLCGAQLKQKNISKHEMDHGSKLLKQLMDAQFPLAFKVSGDLAYIFNQLDHAIGFYLKAVNLLKDDRLLVECFRNMGHIHFKQLKLIKARECFTKACELSTETRNVSDCHFMLAQLRENNRLACRQHLEIAAQNGVHESFPILGELLLNFFDEPQLAREWFKLGVVTDKSERCLRGLHLCALRLKDENLRQSVEVKLGSRGGAGAGAVASGAGGAQPLKVDEFFT